MFPLVPVQGIQVVCWKPAIGTHDGFFCVHLPNMSITPILGYCNLVTLGAKILIFTPTLINIGSSPDVSSFFTGEGEGDNIVAETSITAGGAVDGSGIVMLLIDLSNWGKFLAPASFTASLKKPHPSLTILCPAATVWTAKIHIKYINLDHFDPFNIDT